MTKYLALLRGINVGGNTLIKMADLKICFEKLGYNNVRTYINSGNVMFTASGSERALELQIEKALTKTFGFEIHVVVRSFADLQKLMQAVPKGWHTSKDQRLNVMFLRHTIDSPSIMSQLHPKPGIEELYYHPGALFWSAQTSNVSKSGILKIIGTPIYKDMTIRIFRTVEKLYGLMKD